MERRDILKIFFQRLWVFPLICAMTIGGAVVFLALKTPVYQTEVRFLVAGAQKVSSAYYEPSSSLRDVNLAMTTSELLKSRDLLNDVVLSLSLAGRDTSSFDSKLKIKVDGWMDSVADLIGYSKDTVMKLFFGQQPSAPKAKNPVEQAVEDLEGNVSVATVEKTDVIMVTIKDVDPVMAQKIGESLCRYFFLSRVRSEIADLRTQYGDEHPLVQPLIATAVANMKDPSPADEKASIKALMSLSSVKLVQYPFVPQKPVSPRKKWILAGGLASGIMGSLFLIFFLAQTDPLLRSSDEIQTLYNLPLLGTIPRHAWGNSLFAHWRPQGIDPHAFVPLAYQIQAARLEHNVSKLFFASADDSKSNQALINILAYGLSRTLPKNGATPKNGTAPKSLVLVETEQEGQRFLQEREKPLVSAETGKSLVDYFQGTGEIKDVVRQVDDNLSIVTLRKNSETAFFPFDPEKCRAFMDTMASMFDLVLVRAPQFSKRSEFAFFHSLCQASVIIAGEQTTRKKVLENMVAVLKKNDAPILGVVLNNQDHSLPKFIYSLT